MIAESTFVARPAMHVLLSYVYVAPTAPNAAGTSLTRAGATWLPVRRRLTIEDRFLFERRASTGTGSFLRGRNRLRISKAQTWGSAIRGLRLHRDHCRHGDRPYRESHPTGGDPRHRPPLPGDLLATTAIGRAHGRQRCRPDHVMAHRPVADRIRSQKALADTV